MTSGSASIDTLGGVGAFQSFRTIPTIEVVTPLRGVGAFQSVTATKNITLASGVAALTGLKLPNLTQWLAIVDDEGRPESKFHRDFQKTIETIEAAIQALAQSDINQATLINEIQAAQATANAANLAASAAVAETTTQSALQGTRDSDTSGLTVSASTSGSVSTISISAHNRIYLDPAETVPVDGGSVGSLTPSTVYYISYDDSSYSGGAVTYLATVDKTNAVASQTNPYRHYVGGVTTPAVDGGSSSGVPAPSPPWDPTPTNSGGPIP